MSMKLKFGSGKVGVCYCMKNGGRICFAELQGNYKVGDKVNPSDGREKQLIFSFDNNTQSVDVVIRNLKKLKAEMIEERHGKI